MSAKWGQLQFVGELTLPIRAGLSHEEFNKLQVGLTPHAMEQKWFICFDAPFLYFYRSWSRVCVYRMEVETRDGEPYVEHAHWDPESFPQDAEQLKYQAELAKFMLLGFFLGRPLSAPIAPSVTAAQSFSSHYANLHTEELVDLMRKDLADEARVALNAEIKRRGISIEQVRQLQAESCAERDALARLASRRKRFIAFKLDLLGVPLALSVALLALVAASAGMRNMSLALLWSLYMLFRDSIGGQSLGKRLLGLKVIHHNNDQPATWRSSLLRNLTLLVLPIDVLFALGDERQRLGDRLAKTIVVNARLSG